MAHWMSARIDCLARHVDFAKAEGLEIGPLDRPVIRPAMGSIRYADHLPEADLRAKYADQDFSAIQGRPDAPTDLVPLDYVVAADTLAGPPEASFHYLVASHVIEHVPNPIRWLEGAAALLKPGGVVWLAVPNRLYTFDRPRPPTTAGDWLEAHWQERDRPSPRQVFDELRWATGLRQEELEAAWNGGLDQRSLVGRLLARPIDMTVLERARHSYRDVHCTIADELDMALILRDVSAMGMLGLQVREITLTPPGGIEFYIVLSKPGGTAPDEAPPTAAERVCREIFDALARERADQVPATSLSRSKLFKLWWRAVRAKAAPSRRG